ncbi:MAG TPA: TIR domain-containing protein [Pyrinomonadaceae bacterium]|jgi:hypothetical protein
MAHEIFISYSSKDEQTAQAITAALEEQGISCWIAPRDVLPGLPYGEAIIEAINQCRLLLLVFSAHSNKSQQVLREVERAVSKGINIIPFRIENAPMSKALEYFLSTPHWLDASTQPLEKHFQTLVETVRLLRERHGPESATLEQQSKPTALASQEPHLGSLVFKLCNRAPQVSAFADFFIDNLKQRPGSPQIYFIHGEESECHDSLVERLIHTQINQIVEKRWGEQRGTVVFKKPRWPHEGESGELRKQLKRMLFSEFDPAYMDDDLSASALSKLAAMSLKSLILIRHNIYSEQWTTLTRDLIQWYLSYWAEGSNDATGPQFLIFFNVIYSKVKEKSWWKSLLSPQGYGRERIQKEIQEISAAHNASSPCLVLKELTPPREYDVGDWFTRHNIYDAKVQGELLKKIFAASRARQISMADVEHELQTIHQSFIKERSYF